LPLVSVLRDTLGDQSAANDRISDVWLLTYAEPNLGQKLLSAVPFFFWHFGGSESVKPTAPVKPFLNLTSTRGASIADGTRQILQWTVLDPMMMPVRASSRAYRTNQVDHERLHLEEAVSYLRQAPASDGTTGLTQHEIDVVVARLELRKTLLGGFVSARAAARLGAESGYEMDRVRTRNWEILRQCAEKGGLLFEPLRLAGTTNDYAVLWFPVDESPEPQGQPLSIVWKILNIKNPWSDERLRHSEPYLRWVSESGELLPHEEPDGKPVHLAPLAVYSLTYRKQPLILIDFRDKLRVRRHELAQRSINEVTSGVLGLSHFANWYYFAGADLYDFIASRRGTAVSQAERLDCYSQFRVDIALDQQLDPRLHGAIQARIDSLAVDPLEAKTSRELQNAELRHDALQHEIVSGRLLTLLNNERRYELASYGESTKEAAGRELLHVMTFGKYTPSANGGNNLLAQLDCYRRVQNDLDFLNALTQAGTPPEVSYDDAHLASSVSELQSLIPRVPSQHLRRTALELLSRVRALSNDSGFRGQCLLAINTINNESQPRGTGILASPRVQPAAIIPEKLQ
jgi:hypothetical protein